MGGRGAEIKIKTHEDTDILEWYVSGDGMWINNYLRGLNNEITLTDEELSGISRLDKATNERIKEDTLYRSVDASAIFGKMTQSQYENLWNYIQGGENALGKGAYAQKVMAEAKRMANAPLNKIITDKGYMSTTTDSAIAEEWGGFTGSSKPVVLKIKTSKNTRGKDISFLDRNVSEDMAQKERLLKRGQSYIPKKVYMKNGNIYVDVSMI